MDRWFTCELEPVPDSIAVPVLVLRPRAATLCICLQPIPVVKPSVFTLTPVEGGGEPVPTPSVKLTHHAYELLRKQGPVVFQEEYGSHFVSGYTVGMRRTCLEPKRPCCGWLTSGPWPVTGFFKRTKRA